MNRTWELANTLLTVVVEAYSATPELKKRLPARRFAYAGSVAYDTDDALFVTWTGGAGYTGDPAATSGAQRVQVYAARSARFLVGVTRCAPSIREGALGQFFAPPADELMKAGELVTDDEALVRKAIIEAHLNQHRFGEGPVLALLGADAIPASAVTGFTLGVQIGLSSNAP